jgi:Domain of unknown function (DUF4384)
MRSVLGVVSLTLLAAGCALNRPPNTSYAREAARYRQQPLEAYVWSDPSVGVSYMVNRPAYVAIFEVSPDNGVAMLYPTYAGDVQQTYGTRLVIPAAANTARWAYESSLGNRLSLDTYFSGWNGPEYLMVIASERPLAVSQFVQRPFALRTAMGYTNFLAHQPFEAMKQVVNMVLPQPVGGDWTTNVYMTWREAPQQRFVALQCNGRVLTVPAELAYQAIQLCAFAQQQIAANCDSTAGKGPNTSGLQIGGGQSGVKGVSAYPVEVGATESMPGVQSGRRHGGASTQPLSGGVGRVAGPPPGRPSSADRGAVNTRPSAPPRMAPRPWPTPMPMARQPSPAVMRSAPPPPSSPPPRPHHGSSHGHGAL